MIKKRLSLLFIILFCVTLNSGAESFAPDVEPTAFPTTLVKSPFLNNSEKSPSNWGFYTLSKYGHELSAYERKEILKISALFTTIEAISAGISCAKTCIKSDISQINFLLAGLFTFRTAHALSHLYLTYQAIKNFNPHEDRENPDTEENKKEAAAAQYEVAWKVAGTVADSPLFERIRQESYNFAQQSRGGGLERLKPLLPIIYPLASGFIGAAFDSIKICQTFRTEPLFAGYKDTEPLILELGSLLAHTYASGNIIDILPASIKKYTLSKGLTATYYLSLFVASGLLLKNVLSAYEKDLQTYSHLLENIISLKQKLPQSLDGEAQTSFEAFINQLSNTFKPVSDGKKITITNPESAPKCMHCQERVSLNDELLVKGSYVMHVRGYVRGHARYCFIEKLVSTPGSCTYLPQTWLLQKPKQEIPFNLQHYKDSIYRSSQATIDFEKKFKEAKSANSKDQMTQAIILSQRPVNYNGLSETDKQALLRHNNTDDTIMKCGICFCSCIHDPVNNGSNTFIIAATTHQSYHPECLAEAFLTADDRPTDPTSRADVITNWKNWQLYSIANPAA